MSRPSLAIASQVTVSVLFQRHSDGAPDQFSSRIGQSCMRSCHRMSQFHAIWRLCDLDVLGFCSILTLKPCPDFDPDRNPDPTPPCRRHRCPVPGAGAARWQRRNPVRRGACAGERRHVGGAGAHRHVAERRPPSGPDCWCAPVSGSMARVLLHCLPRLRAPTLVWVCYRLSARRHKQQRLVPQKVEPRASEGPGVSEHG